MTKRSDDVLKWVEDYIRRKRLGVGDPLPHENEIAAHTGAGRSSVREALTALKALGIIISKRKGGIRIVRDPGLLHLRKYFANTYDDKQLHVEAMEFRSALELGLAGLVFANAKKEDTAALEAIVDRCEKPGTTQADLNHAEIEFHTRLIRLAGNEVAALLTGIIIPVFDSIRAGRACTEKEIADWVQDHRGLIEALRGRDVAVYQKAMAHHMRGYLRAGSIRVKPFPLAAEKEVRK
ncbi:MAG TPA: FCD domain-containing protein [Planctomycetota bacterium]|nr:FCD domain-containing protein [Planctomycetota bacterium]